MKKTLLLATTTALMGFAFAAPAASAAGKGVTVMSWGGAYGNSQIEAYDKPFTKETGIKVTMVSADNPGTVIKSMVEAKNVNVDVFDVETSDAVRLCDEGLLTPINDAMLPPAPDGTPATKGLPARGFDPLRGGQHPVGHGSCLQHQICQRHPDHHCGFL